MYIYKGLDEIKIHFMNFFWAIGFFGWHISGIYAGLISYNYSPLYFYVYFFVFLLTGWLNHDVLKNYINDLRPADSKPFLKSEIFKKRVNGMPSGHAQQTAFSLTFAYLITGKYYYESWGLFLLTIFQRFVFKNHTIPQLFIGSVLGIAFGYATFYLLQLWLKMNKKLHDNNNTYSEIFPDNTIKPIKNENN